MHTPISDDVEETRLSIMRALWACGEDTLLERIEKLRAKQVTLIGTLCAARLVHEPRRDVKHVRLPLIATVAVEFLEGASRELARPQHRHMGAMPGRLRGWSE